MSSECTAWVFRHSPATGAAFAVHLAAADSANDQHDYELWMRQHRLATKARVSRRAVSAALAWLCDNGLLELIQSGATAGAPNRYRFLMPELPVLFDPRGGAQEVRTPPAPDAQGGAQQVLTGVRTSCTQNPRDNPRDDPKGNAVAVADRFDEFWSAYPRKVGKGQARPAWKRALGKTTADAIIAGAVAYAHDPNRDESFTAHPSSWLNGERWNDPPLPPRGGQPTTARMKRIASRPDGLRRLAEAAGYNVDDPSDPLALPPGDTP